MPSSPRGWLSWALYTLDAQGRPFSPSYEYLGRTDPRMWYSRDFSRRLREVGFIEGKE